MRLVIASLASVLWVAGNLAHAEPWIDYELLRQTHADKVVTVIDADGNESWSLDLGDGVTVNCSSSGCVGSDMKGAVGCTFSIVSEVKAIAGICALPVEPEVLEGLDRVYERLGRFVAENAVPPQDWSSLSGYADTIGQSYRDEMANEGPEACEAIADPESDVMILLQNLSELFKPENEAKLAEGLSRPRLPVMNPCL